MRQIRRSAKPRNFAQLAEEAGKAAVGTAIRITHAEHRGILREMRARLKRSFSASEPLILRGHPIEVVR